MITQQELDKFMTQFDMHESRASFYPMFQSLIERDLKIQAFVMILSTWNIAYFSKSIRTLNLAVFEDTVNSLSKDFERVSSETLSNISFPKYEKEIKNIYDALSRLNGVKYTGASKIMHLSNPNLFVMWDQYISKKLQYDHRKADDYYNFMIKMQSDFTHLKSSNGKTLAKCVDEYNYVNYTLPALEKQRKKRKERTEKKQK